MRLAEIDTLESQLGIRFPQQYRDLLLKFPFPHLSGNSDAPIFDDPRALLELNQQYRRGFAGMDPWPPHYLFIGDDGAASCYALDLRANPPTVLLLDHGNCDAAEIEARSIEDWLERLKFELKPEIPRPSALSPGMKAALIASVAFLAILFLFAIVNRLLTGRPL